MEIILYSRVTLQFFRVIIVYSFQKAKSNSFAVGDLMRFLCKFGSCIRFLPDAVQLGWLRCRIYPFVGAKRNFGAAGSSTSLVCYLANEAINAAGYIQSVRFHGSGHHLSLLVCWDWKETAARWIELVSLLFTNAAFFLVFTSLRSLTLWRNEEVVFGYDWHFTRNEGCKCLCNERGRILSVANRFLPTRWAVLDVVPYSAVFYKEWPFSGECSACFV